MLKRTESIKNTLLHQFNPGLGKKGNLAGNILNQVILK